MTQLNTRGAISWGKCCLLIENLNLDLHCTFKRNLGRRGVNEIGLNIPRWPDFEGYFGLLLVVLISCIVISPDLQLRTRIIFNL